MPAPKVTVEEFVEIWLEAHEMGETRHWVADRCDLSYAAVGYRERRYNRQLEEHGQPLLPDLATLRDTGRDWEQLGEAIAQAAEREE